MYGVVGIINKIVLKIHLKIRTALAAAIGPLRPPYIHIFAYTRM